MSNNDINMIIDTLRSQKVFEDGFLGEYYDRFKTIKEYEEWKFTQEGFYFSDEVREIDLKIENIKGNIEEFIGFIEKFSDNIEDYLSALVDYFEWQESDDPFDWDYEYLFSEDFMKYEKCIENIFKIYNENELKELKNVLKFSSLELEKKLMNSSGEILKHIVESESTNFVDMICDDYEGYGDDSYCLCGKGQCSGEECSCWGGYGCLL